MTALLKAGVVALAALVAATVLGHIANPIPRRTRRRNR